MLIVLAVRAMNVSPMRLETKYLRFRTPVTIGSYFGRWRVCWLGGWGRDRLFYYVKVVRVKAGPDPATVAFRCGPDFDHPRARYGGSNPRKKNKA